MAVLYFLSHYFLADKLFSITHKKILFFLLVYGLSLAMYFTTRKNYRKREEYGSAKWGSARLVNKKYSDKDKFKNKLLTQNVAIGLDGRKHRRNLNTLVCGGSGAGKTRFYVKPNIMQCNCSYVILDPKRRNFERYRTFIRKRGL